MATKEELLQYIKTIGERNLISRHELLEAYDSGSGVVINSNVTAEEISAANNHETTVKTDHVISKKFGIAEVLSYIGGAIVFLGIAILVGQNWERFGFFTKVLVTLGSGIAAYIVGVVFNRDNKTETIAPAFYLISALVSPIGLFVIFENAGFVTSGYGAYFTQTLISGILLATYVASYVVFKKNVFALFSIIFGTWLFFSITSMMVSDGSFLDTWQFYEYRFLVASVSYLALGYSFSKSSRAPLKNFLYGFGVFGLLATALSLGQWSPDQNVFWELIYPILLFGVLYLSVTIRSNSFLMWGSFFLMVYILKITAEYFTNGLGWSFSLVVAGLALIGVGYMSLNLKKKYISNKSQPQPDNP